MKINRVSNTSSITLRSVSQAKGQEPLQPNIQPAATVSGADQTGLIDQLQGMPGVREEVVALGRKLARDPNYPPPEVVEKLAQIVTGYMQSPDDPPSHARLST